MNSSLYQRIMREDENLIQEHVYNQKKKDSKFIFNKIVFSLLNLFILFY